MGAVVPWSSIAYASSVDAEAALDAVGARVLPQLTSAVPGVDGVVRVFGVLSNLLDDEEERTDLVGRSHQLRYVPASLEPYYEVERRVTRDVRRRLSSPDNDTIRTSLIEGKLRYTPGNKGLVVAMERVLAPLGIHLPWAVDRPDFHWIQSMSDAVESFGFLCLYSRMGSSVDGPEGSAFRSRRVFSIPFGVDGGQSWSEPISDDVLDLDVGILLEANARA